ncbi:hypothetical protein Tco_1439810 [Tanacetum coccineum]
MLAFISTQSHDLMGPDRDHPLEQVRGNPTMPVQTRRQLATDPKMCMFALMVSIVEPKNIKEAMADSAWIKAMQDELHQGLPLREVLRCSAEGFVDPDHPGKSSTSKESFVWIKASQEPGELTVLLLDFRCHRVPKQGFLSNQGQVRFLEEILKKH